MRAHNTHTHTWFMHAPTVTPPLEAPLMTSLAEQVYLLRNDRSGELARVRKRRPGWEARQERSSAKKERAGAEWNGEGSPGERKVWPKAEAEGSTSLE